jgi:hypothetical protein
MKAGFPNVRVFLDGKTESGATIYKNEDMYPHEHKQVKQPQQQTAATARGFSNSGNARHPTKDDKCETRSCDRITGKLEGMAAAAHRQQQALHKYE